MQVIFGRDKLPISANLGIKAGPLDLGDVENINPFFPDLTICHGHRTNFK